MKNLLLYSLLMIAGTATAQSGNTGFGTSSPGTKIDVNGAITNRETSVAVAANAAAIPANISQAQLTGAATAVVTVTAPSAPNPGQRLIVYNNTTGGFNARLNGITILNGQAVEFIYSNGGWRATNNGLSPITYYLIAKSSANTAWPGNNTTTDLQLGNKAYDPFNILSGNAVTIPAGQGGNYLFQLTAKAMYNSTPTTTPITGLVITVNGTNRVYLEGSTPVLSGGGSTMNGTNITISGTVLLMLNAGDVITFRMFTYNSNNNYTGFFCDGLTMQKLP